MQDPGFHPQHFQKKKKKPALSDKPSAQLSETSEQ
jgi:hypothetical protein